MFPGARSYIWLRSGAYLIVTACRQFIDDGGQSSIQQLPQSKRKTCFSTSQRLILIIIIIIIIITTSTLSITIVIVIIILTTIFASPTLIPIPIPIAPRSQTETLVTTQLLKNGPVPHQLFAMRRSGRKHIVLGPGAGTGYQ